jgi:hypothetical protein
VSLSGNSDCVGVRLYVVRAAFLASLLLGIVNYVRPHTLPVCPPFQGSISTFLFVLNMERVPFDLTFLYTASAPLGLGYGDTGLFGSAVLYHGSSTVR